MSAREPREVEDARDLLGVAELTGILPLHFSAHRISRAAREEAAVAGNALQFKPFFNHEELRTRVRMRHVSDDAVLEAEFEARWEFSEPIAMRTEVLVEFVEKVALMAVVPYLRESVSSNAARLRVQVPELGLVRAGQITMDLSAQDLEDLLQDAWVEDFKSGWAHDMGGQFAPQDAEPEEQG